MNCSYSFMESLLLKDVLGMYTVQQQALHGGIICVLQTQFSSVFSNSHSGVPQEA